jgi:hypothetical protein
VKNFLLIVLCLGIGYIQGAEYATEKQKLQVRGSLTEWFVRTNKSVSPKRGSLPAKAVSLKDIKKKSSKHEKKTLYQAEVRYNEASSALTEAIRQAAEAHINARSYKLFGNSEKEKEALKEYQTFKKQAKDTLDLLIKEAKNRCELDANLSLEEKIKSSIEKLKNMIEDIEGTNGLEGEYSLLKDPSKSIEIICKKG